MKEQLVSRHKRERRGVILVIAIMVTALLAGPVSILELLTPQYPWTILLVIIFIVALEAHLTTTWLSAIANKTNPLAYRAAEVVVILVVLRIITWVSFDTFPTRADLLSYIENPLHFFDFIFVVFALFILFAWNRSLIFIGIFTRLNRNKYQARQFLRSNDESGSLDSHYYASEGSAAILRDYYREWVFSGLILVFAAALTTLHIENAESGFSSYFNLRNISRLEMHSGIMLALIIYFMAGFWLASQARLSSVQTRWYLSKVEPEPQIEKRWQQTTIVILFGVSLIAAFLPIGSTFAISRLIQIAIAGITALAALVISIAVFIYFSILARLFGRNLDEAPQIEFEYQELVPPTLSAGQPAEFPQFVIGALFWIAAGAVTIAALWIYFHNRGLSLRGSGLDQLVRELILWLRSWFGSAASRVHEINSGIFRRLRPPQLEKNGMKGRFRFIRFNNLPAHEQLRFFYLSTIRRARDKGVPRDINRTPLEFTGELKSGWPDSSSEIDSLTHAFIKARYSKQAIEPDDVMAARSIWKQLRSTIKGIRPRGEKGQDQPL